ncbi:MAG: hypothetical protein Q8P18_15395, partial [Pseudomonadota bacterium]|nr:hypothetical protein [Pseudomonadota bacterium]
MSLLLLALPFAAEARDTRKPWVRKIEDSLSAPPTTPGTPVEGTRTFDMDDDGWHGCWQDAMYPAVDTLGGVDIVDAGVVVASGWEVPTWRANPNDPPLEPTALLAGRGITLGRVLGYAPTVPGPSARAHRWVPGTLYEAGEGRVAWLSHEELTIGLLWYAGERPPEALTRCLVPWEGLVARTEAALATRDCGPVIEELYPHTWGAPTPGALPLLERCDAQWRERFAAVTPASDPEEILSVYRYHMVRWSGPKEPLLFPTPPLKWSAHIWGPLDAALERADVTPAQQVIFALLRRAFAREAPIDHSGTLSSAFAAYIPRVAGLDPLG